MLIFARVGRYLMINDLLTAMETRMPWRDVASKAIHLSGGRPRRGWANTKDAAKEGGLNGLNLGELERLYKEHLLVGEKYTKLYPLGAELARAAREAAVRAVVPETPFLAKYPFPMSESEVREAGDGLHLVEVVKTDDGVGLIFCSGLTITKREELNLLDLGIVNDDRRSLLDKFSELYGLRRETVQLFHVVWLPEDREILDIRVDYPVGMPEDTAHILHSQLRRKFAEITQQDIPSTPIDLMPAIGSIYFTEGEGNVVELGFTTVTNSVKNEKMRKARDKVVCLREETYHRAGSKALSERIEPFRISVQWPVPVGLKMLISPEVTLASTSRGIGASQINGVAIRNCLETAQYLFTRDKLLKHVGL